MRILKFISKLLIGLTFTFSGFVKCLDPLGTAYKINDYLVELGLTSMTDYAVILSVLMCGIELLIGLMLLLNIKVVWGAWMAMIFMAFYTPLTLYLAIYNPISDCGCFGDALILTNWQTFFKNVILILLAAVLFVYRREYRNLFNPFLRYIALLLLAAIVFGFEWYSLNRLPIMDFRPYKVGINIQEGMEIPEGAPRAVTEFIFVYEKNGQKQEFTMENLPGEDWTFVERKDKVLSKGYEPPINNFSISDSDGWDITEEVLNGGYIGLIIAYDLETASAKNQPHLNELANFLMSKEIRVLCLTSSPESTITNFKQQHNARYEFGIADPITLKTIVRSNPGLVLLKNGTILNKWHHKHLPEVEELDIELQLVEY